mgnify:CR=1 FL=1
MEIMGLIADRRAETERRLGSLRERLDVAETLIDDNGCVYLTGSFARGEASRHSDLDLFIVGRDEPDGDTSQRLLPRLDEICIKAELIRATRDVRIPEFSGDGQYLVHYTIDDLVRTLGRPEDDANNTFTARILLLLESKPLLGREVHSEAVKAVLKAYWRDYEDHRNAFVPAFMANDILRMWRTFCVNYEARTQTEPEQRKAKRKLKNYKLKHSRLLTCYSAIAFLSAFFRRNGTVGPQDAETMVRMTPTERLEWIRDDGDVGGASVVEDLLCCYEQFLAITDESEDTLVAKFMDAEKRAAFPDASRLGELMAKLLVEIGDGSQFHRLLLV